MIIQPHGFVGLGVSVCVGEWEGEGKEARENGLRVAIWRIRRWKKTRLPPESPSFTRWLEMN